MAGSSSRFNSGGLDQMCASSATSHSLAIVATLDPTGEVSRHTPDHLDGDLPDFLTGNEREGLNRLHRARNCLGKNNAHLLRLKKTKSVVPFLQPDEPEDMQVLDVIQLHTLVLRQLLHIDTKQSDQQQYVSYKVDMTVAMEMVESGEYNLAFFMNATKMDQVRELAEKGIRLPQKATFFYPKLLSGLVINKFES